MNTFNINNFYIKKFNINCPCDQIFGIPHFYIFIKSMTFLLNLPNFNSLRAWKLPFSKVFIQDYTAAINQACSGSDVKDSKLKATWLIILNVKAVKGTSTL